jgi:hypothetical protein
MYTLHASNPGSSLFRSSIRHRKTATHTASVARTE